MQDLFAALISFVLVQPLETGLREKFEAARAPQAAVAQISACIETATPALAERAWSDPWWVASTSFRVWTGTASLDAVAAEAIPACAPAIRAIAPHLRASEA